MCWSCPKENRVKTLFPVRLGKTKLVDGKSIGGRGRQTNKVIGNTHRIKDMEKAVMAIWHYTRSTDEKPDHKFCSSVGKSWCGYQRALAKKDTSVILYQKQFQIS